MAQLDKQLVWSNIVILRLILVYLFMSLTYSSMSHVKNTKNGNILILSKKN